MSIIKVAKKNGTPYSTTEMDTKSFIDLTSLCNVMSTNYSINEINGETILMRNIVVIYFKKESPFILCYDIKQISQKMNTKL
jgi:hypothetical protein